MKKLIEYGKRNLGASIAIIFVIGVCIFLFIKNVKGKDFLTANAIDIIAI